ncbi:hypothetical protein FOXG_21926 [Fusarium oxysporum f. sp. lycopersici 4287]|uniref:Uncharacterized protein n=2 Tax=Fusarium oxysporum TaxID=5507 RepID=A0A0J9W3C0_FUSO4|nr:hypothetical protein FOXG_21926 [Fusarium oxysporum f. sp. lycopersici 4287]XP_018255488.1 hypothetical protein FOXG_21926 [Fusarium oxysporum f. sp. lycopersici 4287]XP_018255489.1 hypothetical protein FOXG_21926 [Fusarium oxysporum f. sp. lycopersici 4287]EXK43104.1 hypothetical protein FOMG_05778 [Fusarium oxysporum f. sp. melonis 26406]EXK43105.1 hypothetical protein FOMG_05778 [Fusarium oxysporum f. sp. melonis 26406]EXK43106.1 hypothetical protein FOMG_05778 [Fusarium oxysporum f. sp.
MATNMREGLLPSTLGPIVNSSAVCVVCHIAPLITIIHSTARCILKLFSTKCSREYSTTDWPLTSTIQPSDAMALLASVLTISRYPRSHPNAYGNTPKVVTRRLQK